MSLTYNQAVEQTITAGEQIHQIVNGTATTEVTVEDGSKVPSIRKALLDNFYFKDPIVWQVGQTENVFNQLRQFTDGSWWYAPSATASNPISMGSTPVGDPLWKIYDFDAIGKLTPQLREALRRSYAEAGYALVVGSFEQGGTLATGTDVLLYEAEGKAYSWDGVLPKVVMAGSSPTPIATGAWVLVGDMSLRGDLAAASGADIVGFQQAGAGSVKRTAQDKMRESVSVRDFGAVGDGVTDDTLSVQSALNSRGIVVFPPGTYKVSGPLQVSSDTIVCGGGVIESSDQTSSVLRCVDVNNVELNGITVNRYLLNGGPNNDSSNIYFQRCNGVRVINCSGQISRHGTVINMQNTSKAIVTGCRTSAHSLYDPKVLQTASTIAAPNGIYVGDACTDVQVHHNICTNLGHGVAIQNTGGQLPIYNVSVSFNNISECGAYGIFSYRLSESVYNVTISDNIIENIYGTYYNNAIPSAPYTHGSGIYGQTVYRHTIKNNLIRNVCVNTSNTGTLSPAGIGFASVSDFIVTGNIVSKSGVYGIICDGERNNISNNNIKETVKAGVYLRGSYGSVVHGNAIKAIAGQGILTTGAAGGLARHDFLSISCNFIQDSKNSIVANACYDSSVIGNIIDAANVANNQGITTDTNGDNLRICNNSVIVGGGAGIRSLVKSTITGNYVRGSAGDQSITLKSTNYYADNETDFTGLNTPYYAQDAASANVITLKYLTNNIRLNITDNTNALHAITTIPEWSTVVMRVPSGTAVKNMTGTVGFRFRFSDGLDRVTTKTTVFTFVALDAGVLFCSGEYV